MITSYPVITRLILSLIDILIIIASFIIASYVRNYSLHFNRFGEEILWNNYLGILMLIILTWRGIFEYQEAYQGQRFTSFKSEIHVVIKTVIFGSLFVLTVAFLVKSSIPRSLIAFFTVINLCILCVERYAIYRFISYLRLQGKNIKRVLVLGAGDVAESFIKSVHQYPDWGIEIVGMICKDEANVGDYRFGHKLLGHSRDMRKILHDYQVDELIIAIPAKYFHAVEDAIAICDEEGLQVRIISPFFRNLISKSKTDMIHGLPIIKFSSVERKDLEAAAKRGIDILASIFLLIILSPVMAIISFMIKFDSKGPIFYRWKVLGLNKRPLTSYKFRTMVIDADKLKNELHVRNEMTGPVFKMTNDPRVTKIGKWLRKFSLDELPQLWSVLKGDLSLVGPRPPLQSEVEKYEGWHRRKLSVKPGITCLWQVSGRNEIKDFNDWMRLDMKYIDEWSLWLDFKIIAKTVLVVFRGTGR